MKENQNLNQNDEKRYRKWNEKSIKKFILFKISSFALVKSIFSKSFIVIRMRK